MKADLKIYNGQFEKRDIEEVIEISFENILPFFALRNIKRHILAYHSVEYLCNISEQVSRPFLRILMCRLLTRGKCQWKDFEGNVYNLGLIQIGKELLHFIKEHLTYHFDFIKHKKIVNSFKNLDSMSVNDNFEGSVLYLRQNLPTGLISGGSVSHAMGIICHLHEVSKDSPIVITFEGLSGLPDTVHFFKITEAIPYRNVKDYMSISANNVFYKKIVQEMEGKNCAFVYQRASLNAYAGLRYALENRLPFVLEYNSSEVWTSKHWSNSEIRFIQFSEKVEKLLLEKADLITCVSNPLKEQLIEQNIDEKKVIVTPNGVEPNIYNPSISGTKIRQRYAIFDDMIVIGFIGTFGKWHGTEVLLEAFQKLRVCEGQSFNCRLLLIGDGIKMPYIKQKIHEYHLEEFAILTGSIPQKDGPDYLAACDILVSPTIRNPDGSPFFGSPTKIFEYMAMGKAIISSAMDQMTDIFTDGFDALLCEPGNMDELYNAMHRLIKDHDMREHLGKNARKNVCESYTWEKHVNKIAKELKIRLRIETGR